MARIPELLEPTILSDTFVTGVGDIEELAPNLFRLILYAEGKCHFEEGRRERVAVEKLIMTGDAMAFMARALLNREIDVNAMVAAPAGAAVN